MATMPMALDSIAKNADAHIFTTVDERLELRKLSLLVAIHQWPLFCLSQTNAKFAFIAEQASLKASLSTMLL